MNEPYFRNFLRTVILVVALAVLARPVSFASPPPPHRSSSRAHGPSVEERIVVLDLERGRVLGRIPKSGAGYSPQVAGSLVLFNEGAWVSTISAYSQDSMAVVWKTPAGRFLSNGTPHNKHRLTEAQSLYAVDWSVLRAYNLTDGSGLWEFGEPDGGVFHHLTLCHKKLLAENRVHHKLYAFDKFTGTVAWVNRIDPDSRGHVVGCNWEHTFQFYSHRITSLKLADGKSEWDASGYDRVLGFSSTGVLATAISTITAKMTLRVLSLDDGKEMWTIDADPSPFRVHESRGGLAFSVGSTLHFIRLKDGAKIWERTFSEEGKYASDEHFLYVSFNGGAVYALNQDDGGVVWQAHTGISDPEITLVGDKLILVSPSTLPMNGPRVGALEVKGGKKLWMWRPNDDREVVLNYDISREKQRIFLGIMDYVNLIP